MDAASLGNTVLWLVFGVAFAVGALLQKTRFCTMGAVADIVNMGDWNRMRMWFLAIGVAILGSTALHAAGVIDLDKSMYRSSSFPWLSYLVGGFSFGSGMVLASGCGAKTLVRIGGGSLKALVVCLALGITAYITLRGILGIFRVKVLEKASFSFSGGQDLPALLTQAGVDPGLALWGSALTVGGGLIALALASRPFRTPDNLLGGIGVGLAVVAAWYISGHVGYLAEDPETLQEAFIATNSGRLEALSFVAPQAYGLELLMLWSDSSRKLTFGIAAALGVIAGSAAWAIATRTFRWEGFRDTEDTAGHLLGAVLMGFGGITAMGCTVGQGISGISTLALGSFLTFHAIIVGAVVALKYQYRRLMRTA